MFRASKCRRECNWCTTNLSSLYQTWQGQILNHNCCFKQNPHLHLSRVLLCTCERRGSTNAVMLSGIPWQVILRPSQERFKAHVTSTRPLWKHTLYLVVSDSVHKQTEFSHLFSGPGRMAQTPYDSTPSAGDHACRSHLSKVLAFRIDDVQLPGNFSESVRGTFLIRMLFPGA